MGGHGPRSLDRPFGHFVLVLLSVMDGAALACVRPGLGRWAVPGMGLSSGAQLSPATGREVGVPGIRRGVWVCVMAGFLLVRTGAVTVSRLVGGLPAQPLSVVSDVRRIVGGLGFPRVIVHPLAAYSWN